MADRIGVINKGEIILVEDKARADAQARPQAADAAPAEPAAAAVPPQLAGRQLELSADGTSWSTPSTRRARRPASPSLLRQLNELGIDFKDLHTSESSLEEIFVSLVRAQR